MAFDCPAPLHPARLSASPFGPNRRRKGDRVGAFLYRLEREDGTPADPPTLQAAVPNWRPGDTIALGANRMLRVVDVRNDDADQPPALVVEDLSPTDTGDQAA
jgi:hypothetical protein